MATIDRQELDRLERRGLQLTIFSAVFVMVLASGLAVFMYPLVFVHPEGNKWTLRVAFFGFCALTTLFVGYLFDRQRTFIKLKDQLLAELERNVALQVQASADILKSMPDQKYFWDRLTMEFRRALTMEKTMSLVLIKVKTGNARIAKRSEGRAERRCEGNVQEVAAVGFDLPFVRRFVRNRSARNRHVKRKASCLAATGRIAARASRVRFHIRSDRAQLPRPCEKFS